MKLVYKYGCVTGIKDEWDLEDIKTRAEELLGKDTGDAAAVKVLEYIVKRADANTGITYSVVDNALFELDQEGKLV